MDLGFRLCTAPPVTFHIRVLSRAIYNHIITILQLLLRGGSTEGLGFRVSPYKSQVGSVTVWDLAPATEEDP